jgi:hypothetical protein
MDESRTESPRTESRTPAEDQGHLPAVRELFNTTVKTAKAMNLYMGKGASVQRFVEDLAAAAQSLFQLADRIIVEVRPDGLFFEDKAVEKVEEGKQGIAYEMFADGVRELILMRGIDRRELLDLVEVLRTRRGQLEEAGQDMVTFLWSKNFTHLRFSVVDSFLEDGGGSATGLEEILPPMEGEGTVDIRAADALMLAEAAPDAAGTGGTSAPRGDGTSAPRAAAHPQEGTSAPRPAGTSTSGRAALPQALPPALQSALAKGSEEILGRWLRVWQEMLARHAKAPERQLPLLASGVALFIQKVQAEDLRAIRLLLSALAQADRGAGGKGELLGRFAGLIGASENLQQVILRSASWSREWVATMMALLGRLPLERLSALIDASASISDRDAREEMLRILETKGVSLWEYWTRQLRSESEDDVLAGLRALKASPAVVKGEAVVPLLDHPSLTVRVHALNVMPENRNTAAIIARQLKETKAGDDWVCTLVEWVGETKTAPLLPHLLALARRLDPEKDADAVRVAFEVMAGFGPALTSGLLQQIAAPTRLTARREEERRMLLLATLAETKDRGWMELIRPMTRGWLTSRRLQDAATAALKMLESGTAGKRGKAEDKP